MRNDDHEDAEGTDEAEQVAGHAQTMDKQKEQIPDIQLSEDLNHNTIQ